MKTALLWIPLIICVCGTLGAGIAYLALLLLEQVRKADVCIANTVGFSTQSDFPAKINSFLTNLSDRVELAMPNGPGLSSPLTRQRVLSTPYFVVPKAIVGVISSGIVDAIMIQPLVLILAVETAPSSG
ncbi:hypothetical protein PHYSODRAFT_296219 [Phytophthora sojae]|uniref:Uncharacterized protein n=1 Tax=Phytophthora sojae (strain P6497) TaxID=1094619 RepID=G4Z051_PHYSP|nr:hypothetical protein PHYSODRAFT_296219 [Phytophthora sojae]EGZ23990.1 hypothetical protein PHYSODRAFT_296219 [Phytophthora sojae]|eukprot:XP_009519278.1 hypothetical protein PHYSODRAFT_296219 [Phytophthora sojae]